MFEEEYMGILAVLPVRLKFPGLGIVEIGFELFQELSEKSTKFMLAGFEVHLVSFQYAHPMARAHF